ncbi:MAG: GNAT family N-acetyltransferase [Rubrobacter sp.]|nr:GNAT family N-acetyltransferase [Rubrobacter sp.]
MSAKALETGRLVVRRLEIGDLDDFAALCGDPEAMRHMDDGRPLSRERSEAWLRVSLANHRERGWGCFAVSAKPSERMIGFAGFARPPERPGVVELIYALGADHWRRGYATEVADAMVSFGFEKCGLTRLEAKIHPANKASKRVSAKIGMSHKGRRTNDDGSSTDYFATERKITPSAVAASSGSMGFRNPRSAFGFALATRFAVGLSASKQKTRS